MLHFVTYVEKCKGVTASLDSVIILLALRFLTVGSFFPFYRMERPHWGWLDRIIKWMWFGSWSSGTDRNQKR